MHLIIRPRYEIVKKSAHFSVQPLRVDYLYDINLT
jgi:hypothetical protein